MEVVSGDNWSYKSSSQIVATNKPTPRYTCERFQKQMKSKNHALSITWINRVLCMCSNYRLLKKFSVLETPKFMLCHNITGTLAAAITGY